jgi:hypothetical protein
MGPFFSNGYMKFNFNSERSSFLFIVVSIAFLYAFAGQFFGELFSYKSYDVMKPLFQFFIFIICLLILKEIDFEDFFKINSVILGVLAIISVAIVLHGSFMSWTDTNLRYSSIFKDPNFAGVCFGFGVLASLFFERVIFKLVFFCLCFVGVMLTYSKSSLISVVASLIIYWFFSKGKTTKLLIVFVVIISASVITLMVNYLSEHFELLRVDTGMNRRDIYIDSAMGAFGDNPFEGRTMQDVLDITSLWGENNSLHNTFIESAFYYGVPHAILIMIATLYSAFHYLKKHDWLLLAMLVYVLVSSNSFTFMFGSIGALSIYWMFLVGRVFYDHA